MEGAIFFPPKPQFVMTPSIAFKPAPPLLLRLTPAVSRLFASTSSTAAPTETTRTPEKLPVEPSTSKPRSNGGTKGRARSKTVTLDAHQFKLSWLESLSCPSPDNDKNRVSECPGSSNADSGWVVGVDPDLSGALAVLKPDNSPQVYDSPHLKVPVGNRLRKRLDVKSIIQLLQRVGAPFGTTVYIEQSIPYPQDGKQGWWTGGFGYGLWIGILVASGYSVVPVPSLLWKNEFNLTGERSNKDYSRELATTLFPSMSSLLKRKKDHGRAEALLIAAYGRGLKTKLDSSFILEDLVPKIQESTGRSSVDDVQFNGFVQSELNQIESNQHLGCTETKTETIT